MSSRLSLGSTIAAFVLAPLFGLAAGWLIYESSLPRLILLGVCSVLFPALLGAAARSHSFSLAILFSSTMLMYIYYRNFIFCMMHGAYDWYERTMFTGVMLVLDISVIIISILSSIISRFFVSRRAAKPGRTKRTERNDEL